MLHFFLRYVSHFLSFFLFFVICCEFLISVLQFVFGFVVSILYFLRFFWVFMVGSSEVRIAWPSISFLFARLGGSLGVFPHVESFVF